MEIFGDVITTLQKAMDMRMIQQHVIASNLANIDTPGYVAQRMDFKTSLVNALDGAAEPVEIASSTAPPLTLDGNNVDLEGELSEMSHNRFMYDLTARLMRAKFQQVTDILDREP